MTDLFGMLEGLTVPNIKASPQTTAQQDRQKLSRDWTWEQRRKANYLKEYRRARDPRTKRYWGIKIRHSNQALARMRTSIRQTDARVREIGAVADRDVKDYIRGLFTRNDLPRSLADWAYGVLVEGASGTEMVQRMYDRPEFKTRFAGLFEYEKKFPDAPAISPAEVLAYEREGMQIFHAAGMPPQFYDHWSDFVPQISSGRSMAELAEVVQEGFMRVTSSPRTVRDAFASFFGPSGDAALAAFFIDPKKAVPALRQQVAAAEVAGAGFNFGFTLGRETALEIGGAGYDFQSSQDRFANLLQMRPVFQETVGEGVVGEDLGELDEGVDAVFGTEGAGAATQAIERRVEERTAAFGGGGGAMGSLQSGARGLGSARQP